jgi:hypothetical protein
MTMADYLNEMKHAASEALRLIWSEHKQLEELEALIARLAAEIEESQRRITWLRDNPEFDDDFQGTYMTYESYFGPEKDKYYAEKSKPELEASLSLRKFSTGALSANILQYGKQGISFVHGQLGPCPDGRLIGTQALKSVIWQSRNQALHWEEGTFSPQVTECFNVLARDIDPKFSEFIVRNMAWDIVGLVGWNEFADFERDMLSLS